MSHCSSDPSCELGAKCPDRRNYPDMRSIDDSLEMFGRFGPHKCPPEYLITIYHAAMEHAPYGDRSTETLVGSKWYPIEGCNCESCVSDGPHTSDCAVHNGAEMAGRTVAEPCDCGRRSDD